MASIRNTRGKVHDKIGQGFDTPSEHVESEGDKLIKTLYHKQIDTNISLESQLKIDKGFIHSTEFVPVTQLTKGQTSLHNFKICDERLSHIEELKSYDLTDEDIELLECNEFCTKRTLEPSVLQSRLKEINDKIVKGKERLNSTQEGGSSSARHQIDLGSCVKPESKETKLFKFASSNLDKFKDNRPSSHPINQLGELEDELFSHLKQKTEVPPLKKRRKLFKRIEQKLENSNKFENEVKNPSNCNTKWDLKTVPSCSSYESQRKERQQHTYSCLPEKLYTVKNNTIVEINDGIVENSNVCTSTSGKEFVSSTRSSNVISIDHIKKFRLSLEEIKKIPRFENYEVGSPNKTLFIKNLSPGVTEDDLISIFNNYQNPKEPHIIYRLMKGKMKGQAFITLINIERAKQALQNTNGFILKGKPIIIQYGNKK